MVTNIFPVVVVYNKSIEDSITLNSFRENAIPNENVIVVDNSTSDYGVGSYCQSLNYRYISMNGNAGLSKAYNKSLDYLRSIAKPDDLVVWLDDDTNITKEYVEILKQEAIKNIECDIFMPIIIGQDGVIYSPNEGRFMRSRFMKSPNDEIDMSKINGINSCLAVRYRLYKNYRYTEDLFMDLTDNQFFDDMRKNNASVNIIRTVIHQSFFQRGDNANINSVIGRFRLRIADFMIYARKKGLGYLFLALVKSYGWGFVTGKKYKSLKIMWTCVFQGTKHFVKNIVK